MFTLTHFADFDFDALLAKLQKSTKSRKVKQALEYMFEEANYLSDLLDSEALAEKVLENDEFSEWTDEQIEQLNSVVEDLVKALEKVEFEELDEGITYFSLESDDYCSNSRKYRELCELPRFDEVEGMLFEFINDALYERVEEVNEDSDIYEIRKLLTEINNFGNNELYDKLVDKLEDLDIEF